MSFRKHHRHAKYYPPAFAGFPSWWSAADAFHPRKSESCSSPESAPPTVLHPSAAARTAFAVSSLFSSSSLPASSLRLPSRSVACGANWAPSAVLPARVAGKRDATRSVRRSVVAWRVAPQSLHRCMRSSLVAFSSDSCSSRWPSPRLDGLLLVSMDTCSSRWTYDGLLHVSMGLLLVSMDSCSSRRTLARLDGLLHVSMGLLLVSMDYDDFALSLPKRRNGAGSLLPLNS